MVLSVAAYGDDDRILRVLTPDVGRLGVFQRQGRRRPAGLDVGVRARLRVRERRGGGLDTLADAVVEDARVHLRRGYLRLASAQYACELVGAFAREGHEEPRLFGLLETFLLLLDALDADPPLTVVAALDLKVLTFAGVGPALDRCAVCGGPVESLMGFDPAAGGARHERCGAGESVDARLLAELEGLRRTPLRDQVDHGVSARALALAEALVTGQLGHPLAARALLAPPVGL